MPGAPEIIPYCKELAKDTTSQKAKGNVPRPKPKLPPTDEAANEMGKMKV